MEVVTAVFMLVVCMYGVTGLLWLLLIQWVWFRE